MKTLMVAVCFVVGCSAATQGTEPEQTPDAQAVVPQADAAAAVDSGNVTDAAPVQQQDSAVPPTPDAGTVHDSSAPDTSTPQKDSGPAAMVVKCGLSPNDTPIYSVTCTNTPTFSDPTVLWIEWQVVPNGNYTVCAAACDYGNRCTVHFKNGTYAGGSCE